MPVLQCLGLGAILLAAGLNPPAGVVGPENPDRMKFTVPVGHIDLGGAWEFRLDPENAGERQNWFTPGRAGEWGAIHVPGSWQAQGYGLDYHGTGWYRRSLEIPAEWAGRQIWLRVAATATRAKVWIDGHLVGEHLGNWAPFSFRITGELASTPSHQIVVRVEELPKHFSAGFWRVLGQAVGHDAHFGGIWQEVSLYATGEAHVDDLWARPRLAERQVDVEATVSVGTPQPVLANCIILAPDGREVARSQKELSGSSDWAATQVVRLTVPVPEPKLWSPETPVLYTARIDLAASGKPSDRRDVRFGMREVRRQGSQLLLNGKPLYVRGMLHWGYYPHLLSIAPSEEQIRREFTDLRAAGFNLVKVCLFVFPRRFYDIADETGMLVWQEYPTWQSFPSKDAPGPHDQIVREFAEWHRFDRNHPSVILRSLSCEAKDPDPSLMEQLYAQAKRLTGGEMIEDNSAYMNQVLSDWYDAHIYVDLDDYHAHLVRLAGQLRTKPEIKPYMSGEEMDCDTYRDIAAIRRESMGGGPTPWWLGNKNFELQEQVERELVERHGPHVPAELVRRQNRHALATRKGYIEDFRRYPEFAGFVVCCLRDVTITRPGFYDDLMRPKWPADEWRPFMTERVLVLHSQRRSFCFAENERFTASLLLSNYGDDLRDAPVAWRLLDGTNVLAAGQAKVTAARGQIVTAAELDLALADLQARLTHPQSCRIVADLGPAGAITRNDWPVWVFPAQRADPRRRVFVHSTGDGVAFAASVGLPGALPWAASEDANGSVLLSDNLSAPVYDALHRGARVIYLPADKDERIPHRHAPFWREMAVWLPTGHAVLGDFPHADFVDRQFYDMTQRRTFDTKAFRAEINPLVWGVNARFMGNSAIIADYIFEVAVGKGKLLACCLNVRGPENVAGHHLVGCLVRYATSEDFKPRPSGPELNRLLQASQPAR